jgi:hypothetical protein
MGSPGIAVLRNSHVTVSKPPDAVACEGSALHLAVHAAGRGTLAYQWRKDTVPLSDAGDFTGSSTSTLTIDPASTGDTGSYDVVVTDACGTATSLAANVQVGAIPVAPAITAPASVAANTSGFDASVPPAAGHTFQWSLSEGSIDGGQGTDSISFTSGAPGTLLTINVVDTSALGCASATGSAVVPVEFADVAPDNPFRADIDLILKNRITAGCDLAGDFCPDDPTTRAQMAVFLLKAEHGADYVPPAATGTVFGDVPADAFAAAFIEQLFNEGITAGCGSGDFCPNRSVSRAEMAVFLLRAEHGPSYTPPAATGTVFLDVAADSFGAAFIEQLHTEGITAGCGNGNYCPDSDVTRGEMAVFLTLTFGLS